MQCRFEHFDGRGGTGNEFVTFGAIEGDSDRNTLGQPHPVEGRIDVGKQGGAGAAIAIFDTGRDAFDPPSQHVVTAQQPHVDGVAEVNTRQLGFLEVALDAQRV